MLTKKNTCFENKTLKSEIIELKDEMKLAKKEVKVLKRGGQEIEHDFPKKGKNFESKIRNPTDYKSETVSSEKDAKSKEKILMKKIKALEEEKAKAIIAKNKSERDLTQNKVPKDSKSAFTDLISNLQLQSL